MNVDSSRLFFFCPPFVHKDPTFCTPLSTSVSASVFSRSGTESEGCPQAVDRKIGSVVSTLPIGEWPCSAYSLPLRTLLDAGRELLHLIVDLAPFGHFLANLLVRVHDCRVVATERLSDLGK